MLKIDGFNADISGFLNTSVNKAKNVNSTLNLSQIRKDIKTNNFSYQTSDKPLNVFFSIDNKSIGISLDNKVLNDLKSFFKDNDFLNENGNIILKGDAANYVAGWFSEVAARFSEVSKNAVLSYEELQNVRFGIKPNFELQENNILKMTSIELNTQVKNISESEYELHNTISKDLSDNILKDKNKDGEITLAEFMLDENEEKYLDDLDNTYKYAKIKTDERLAVPDEKIKEYVINEANNYVRKLEQDIKIFKNAKSLKIDEDKAKELLEKDKLDEFCEFSIGFIDKLSNEKMLNIKV